MPPTTLRPSWWRNTRGEWYVIGQTFLFALIAFGPAGVDVRVSLPAGARLLTLAGGLALGGAGLLLALAGLWNLGPNLSVLPHPKDGASLVQTGAYRIVRHPIYSGLILGAVGWTLLNVSVATLIYAGVLFVFFDAKSRREERLLAAKFADYPAYRQRVRKLLPFLY